MYWNQRIRNLVAPILSRSYRQQAAIEEGSLGQALLPFVTPNQYVYVFNRSGSAKRLQTQLQREETVRRQRAREQTIAIDAIQARECMWVLELRYGSAVYAERADACAHRASTE